MLTIRNLIHNSIHYHILLLLMLMKSMYKK